MGWTVRARFTDGTERFPGSEGLWLADLANQQEVLQFFAENGWTEANIQRTNERLEVLEITTEIDGIIYLQAVAN